MAGVSILAYNISQICTKFSAKRSDLYSADATADLLWSLLFIMTRFENSCHHMPCNSTEQNGYIFFCQTLRSVDKQGPSINTNVREGICCPRELQNTIPVDFSLQITYQFNTRQEHKWMLCCTKMVVSIFRISATPSVAEWH